MQSDPNVQEIKFQGSNLEKIDFAMYNWINDQMDIHCNKKEGWEKVPVRWVSAERSFQTKRSKHDYTKDGVIILPVITLERASVAKDPAFKGSAYANIPPFNDYRKGSLAVARTINQEKTSNFANADAKRRAGVVSSPVGFGQPNFVTRKQNKKIVYNTYFIPMPVYVSVMYNITLRTNYQQNMNEMVQPFMVFTGGINNFLIEHEDYKYEAFLQQEFSQNNNINNMTDEERLYETKIDVKVLGQLIGHDNNQETPTITVRENAATFRIQRERIVAGEEIEHSNKIDKFVKKI